MDGHTYERSAIEQWLETHSISPATGLELDSKQLIPNHSLRSLIRELHEARTSASNSNVCGESGPVSASSPHTFEFEWLRNY